MFFVISKVNLNFSNLWYGGLIYTSILLVIIIFKIFEIKKLTYERKLLKNEIFYTKLYSTLVSFEIWR